MACSKETVHQVTLEIAETSADGAPSFQARLRLAGMVTADVGPAQATELDALDVLAKALSVAWCP